MILERINAPVPSSSWHSSSSIQSVNPIDDPSDELADESEDDDMDELSLEAFKKVKDSLGQEKEREGFDGYDFRDALVEKWGECYDVDFNRVDSFGFRKLYLNILPYRLR